MAGKTQIGDWLYFCPQEITVREIYNVFPELEGTEICEITLDEFKQIAVR